MKPENWIGIAQIGVTIIGMFIGPMLAIQWSLRQFRSTKSWEQATQAYSELLKQLAILKHTNRLYYDHAISARRMNKESIERSSKEHEEAR
jgi:hypothetical protein